MRILLFVVVLVVLAVSEFVVEVVTDWSAFQSFLAAVSFWMLYDLAGVASDIQKIRKKICGDEDDDEG